MRIIVFLIPPAIIGLITFNAEIVILFDGTQASVKVNSKRG